MKHSTPVTSREVSSLEKVLVWVVSVVVAVLYAFQQGQDNNWDLLNYHFYNAYAFLNDRSSLDIAAAQMQTWFNPLVDVPIYFAITNFSPKFAALLLAAITATPVPMVYLIAREIWTDQFDKQIIAATFAAFLAFITPMYLSEIATTFGDTLGVFFVLTAIFALLKNQFSPRGYILSGLWIGVACSLKLTNILSAFSMGLAVVLTESVLRQWKHLLINVALMAAGFLITFLPMGGAWAIHLWRTMGNPMFPLNNHIFKSNLAEWVSGADGRFKPKSLMDAISYPLQIALGKHPTSELYFRDFRYLLLMVVILSWGAIYTYKKKILKEPNLKKNIFFLSSFVLIFYAIWLKMFGVERYALVICQLIPLLAFSLILNLKISNGMARAGLSAITLGLLLTAKVPNWGRLPFSRHWFEVQLSQELTKPEILYVIYSQEPESFIIPYFPKSDRFVRISSNLQMSPDRGLGSIAKQIIRNHKGEYRSLNLKGTLLPIALLKSYGLAKDESLCLDVVSNVEIQESCRLKYSE